MEYLDVFAPLVICTTESMPPILKSRAITIIMHQNDNPDVERRIDPEEGRWLREQWTLLRARWMDKRLPDAENVARRRLKEITQPLLRMCTILDPSYLEDFKDFIKYMELEKHENENDTTEAEIVRCIYDRMSNTKDTGFRTKEISNLLNRNRAEYEKYSDKYVAACIERLGFTKTRLHGGYRGFRYDEQLMNKLLEKYQIKPESDTR